jgi:hypothetical protein
VKVIDTNARMEIELVKANCKQVVKMKTEEVEVFRAEVERMMSIARGEV